VDQMWVVVIKSHTGLTHLRSCPYDFWATLLAMTITVRSPNAIRLRASTYFCNTGLMTPSALGPARLLTRNWRMTAATCGADEGSGSVEPRGKRTIQISGSRCIGDGSEGRARTSRSWQYQSHCSSRMPATGKSKASRGHQG
jgi:hypothetical protein